MLSLFAQSIHACVAIFMLLIIMIFEHNYLAIEHSAIYKSITQIKQVKTRSWSGTRCEHDV